MQSFDTENGDFAHNGPNVQTIIIGRVEDLPLGSCKTIELPEGRELAVFNVDGEFYATNNFCPHKGAPLAEGILCGHVIECDWHGWQFDVRTGECLTVSEKLETYEVVVEDGVLKVIK
ncbi:MAG TPA: Rieske 2Fe-2S domain-containing protein [Pyrinomonadaceae bacterium]|nr:Rieske 2Fe-2S domain-containing protein [Pyrinomonadaceae bacterium]